MTTTGHGGGGTLLLLVLIAWAAWHGARAFVRAYEALNALPPRHQKENQMSNRTPLRVTGTIVGGVTALINGLLGAGLVTAGQGDAATGVIAAVVTLLAAFGIVVGTEKRVTPLVDPRDNDGNPLTPDLPASEVESGAARA
ncbi:hypothetical protein OG943_22615 [Amycolatopsis sp. NBC_00345]|uniref:hypothetical protein n=1 Tax=Amycolatopsis sp. NBC_00345 TaxID=2975955 RepID=UPI002E271875